MPASRTWIPATAIAAAALMAAASHAALSVSEVPLFLNATTTPNIVMTLDDSGSMTRGYVPDSIGALDAPRFTASSYNAMYYNPRASYAAPFRTDGVTYSTTFANALVNGFDTGRGSVNLSTPGYRPISECAPAEGYSDCSKLTNRGGSATTTQTTTYTYTNCRLTFNERGRNSRDRIDVDYCTAPDGGYVDGDDMPESGNEAPQSADEQKIQISNSTLNGTYVVRDSNADDGALEIELDRSNYFSSDSTQTGVTISWSRTATETTSAAAYYHLLYTDAGRARPSNCSNTNPKNDDDCYVPVWVGSSADNAHSGRTTAANQQNFANWYSFYRTRALATMSAATNAISALGTDQVRFGWQTLNRSSCTSFGTTCTDYKSGSHENRIRGLDALKSGSTTTSHRTDFYEWIRYFGVSGATPLRGAMDRAGAYFTTSGKDSPYADDPYVARGEELSCRRNFHVMLTDGLWNSNESVHYGGNTDSTSKTLPDAKSYNPRYPYRNPSADPPSGQSYSNSLADIAFKYWSTDLRAGTGALTNNLSPYTTDRSGDADAQYWNPRNNPATWQHMVNFTISFGLSNALVDPAWGGSTYAGDFSALSSGTKYWPGVIENAPGSATPDSHVYDLWHAAVNSRGQFFNADDPAGINSAFQSVFSSILSANPSSAALAANSTSIQTGTMVYQARFDSTDWHGQLIAYNVNADGSIGAAAWDAANKVPAPGSRTITNWNGTEGKSFSSCTADLSTSQRTALNRNPSNVVDNLCSQRLSWLRGTASGEARNGGDFRNRPVSVLGDMINSDPAYVKDEDYGYANAGTGMTERSSYAAYVTSKASRLPMVYIGANDGMLHGFRADSGNAASGQEIMAHVPGAVFDKLNRLSAIGYAHTFFVDGSPATGDAYFGGGWKTVLVSGLGAGGKAVFALDISSPGAHGPSKVLWEFTDTNLGLTFSQPQIARLASGDWVAIFGNGYNSTDELAYLYVVRLSDGTLLKKIAAGTATGNGLATPALIDTNNDMIIDYAYAGDLKGNMWKFDLTSTNAATWGLGNGGGALFTAQNDSGQVQPITTKPALSLPTNVPNGGVMVLFGTGQYLTTTDPANKQVQTFYGIWDNGTPGTVTRSTLQAQTIMAETNEYGYDVRQTSANMINWATQRGWYMNLVQPPSATAQGERVISQPIVRYNRVIFVSTIPTADQCEPGGSSWLMELEANTGSRTTLSVFDFNNDNLFNTSDLLQSGTTASGVKSPVGITKTPVWLEQSRTSEVALKQMSGSSGGIFSLKNRKPATPGSLKRIFWQQIQ